MKRKSSSKKAAAAQREHERFLAKMGVKGRRKLTGAVASPMEVRFDPPHSGVAEGSIPANGAKGRQHTPAGDRIIGQAYNKGPLMVLGSKAELGNAKRRDR